MSTKIYLQVFVVAVLTTCTQGCLSQKQTYTGADSPADEAPPTVASQEPGGEEDPYSSEDPSISNSEPASQVESAPQQPLAKDLNSMQPEFVGNWQMVTYSMNDSLIEAKYPTDAESMYPIKSGVIQKWLKAEDTEVQLKATQRTGLELEVMANSSFAARRLDSSNGLVWFDGEGVCDDFPQSLKGTLEKQSTPNTYAVYWIEHQDEADEEQR